MTRGILHKALALLLLQALWPAPALAQSPKAGVVTTLHGVATVARLAAPPEIPLKFKDDVLFRDRITTRADSVVRVLLGGKALVTVRELSVLTLSEEPDKATVELQAGKIALAVARQRLRPGEQIEIRTPNAVAGVRGTVVIVEVSRATAQVTPGAAAAVTTFYVLSGALNVVVAGQQFTVGALQSLGVAGSVAGQIQQITPTAAQQLKQDYTPPAQHGDSPSEAQQAVVSQQQTQLTALVAAVTGAPPQPTALPLAAQPTTAPTSSTVAPIIATTENPIIPTTRPDVPDVQIAGANVLVTGPLKSFSGTTSRTGTSPVVRITDATVTQLGADNLTQTAPGAAVSLNGSLLEGVRSRITSGGNLLHLSSTLTAPGPLLDITDTTLTLAGAVVNLSGGSTLTITSGPAVRVSGGSLTADAVGIGDGSGNTFHLTGTVVDLSNNATVSLRTLGEDTSHTDTDVAIFTLGLDEPFIRMSNSRLTLSGVDEALVDFGDNPAHGGTQTGVGLIATGSTINLKGNLLDLNAANFTDPNPLIQLTNTTVTQTATADALISIDPDGGTVTMTGPLFKAQGSTLTTSGPVFRFQDGSLTSNNTTDPFLSFNPSRVTSSSNFLLLDTAFSLSLKGTLLDAVDTLFETTSNQLSFFAVVDGSSVTTSGTNKSLLKFTGTAPGQSKVTAARNFLPLAKTTSGSPAPSMTLSGPLLEATKTDFKTGNPSSTATGNTFTFLFVGDSSALTSTSPSALLSFDASTVDTAGNVVTLRRSTSLGAQSKLTLAGPLFSATNGSSFNTTSLGFGASFVTAASACCDGFFVGQGARLTSTTSSPLIQLTNSTFNAGPDAQSGSTFFGIRDTFTGAPAAELVAPASVSLAGPLLKATDSTVMALFDLVGVTRSSLTSTSPDALIQLGGNPGSTLQLGGTRTDPISPGTTAFGRLLFLQSSPVSGTAASGASVSLAGPLLVSNNSTLTMTNDVVSVQNGAVLSSMTSSALIQLTNSSLTAGTPASNADVLEVFGTGGPGGTSPATVSLKGPLLTVGSTLNVTGGLAGVFAGGKVTVTGSTDPFAKIAGGTHSIASNSGMAMFRLFGSPTAVEVAEGVSLTLGTDNPLMHGGVLLETAGATITAQQGFQLDTALFEATKPLFNLLAGSTSTVTSANDFVNLSQKAKLVANLLPGDAMVKLNGSTLNVNNGSLFRVAGGSYLNVTGNLVSLTGGSTLNILNGGLVGLDGTSVFKLTGSLGAFGTGTNTINLPTALAGFTVDTSIIPGFGVALKTGVASAGQVSVAGTFTPFTGAGSVTANGIVLKVNDSGSKVKLCTTGCP